MKKLVKNKFFILSISVITLICIYLFAQKAIDNYFFNTNSDIITEEESLSDDIENKLIEESKGGGYDKHIKENENSIQNDEIDLIVEEIEKSDSVEMNEENEGNKIKDTEKNDLNKIYVYITGEVNNPGVVILDEGSRIVDAINVAGGTTSKANVEKINLVFVLEDGMKVNIPSNSDLKNDSDFEFITLNSGDGKNDEYSNDHTSSNDSSENKNHSKNYEIVNINTATQTELETLPRNWTIPCS